jgi:uncharacterized protein (UPF0276 family)
MNARPAVPIPAEAGIGLRFPHHRAVLEERPRIGWMEVHPENYMGGGLALAHLEAIRRDYPISFHGVGLSLGSAEGIDARHLERLADLVDRLEPGLVSEHVSWSVVDGTYLADLLPLPMTEEALDVVCRNVGVMQDRLRRQVLVENPSSYLRFRHSTIPEWEFMAAIARRTGCGLLCDVNNIFVCGQNHGFDAHQYLHFLPRDSVGEMHVAGHSVRNLDDGRRIRIDDHSREVGAKVWDLLDLALTRFGPVPTLIERDTNVPPLAVLLSQAEEAQHRLNASAEVADAGAA